MEPHKPIILMSVNDFLFFFDYFRCCLLIQPVNVVVFCPLGPMMTFYFCKIVAEFSNLNEIEKICIENFDDIVPAKTQLN